MFKKYVIALGVYASFCLISPEISAGPAHAESSVFSPVPHNYMRHEDRLMMSEGRYLNTYEPSTGSAQSTKAMPPPEVEAPAAVPAPFAAVDPNFMPAPTDYILDSGDVLRLVVFGENELTNRYQVGPEGVISIPLIGDVHVKGLTALEATRVITEKLANGYLVDPSVSIEITSLRPFFILGEVRSPGSYTYIPNMTVLKAVAVAGGFTYRADKKEVEILRKNAEGQNEQEDMPVGEKVRPGDIIFIKERFF